MLKRASDHTRAPAKAGRRFAAGHVLSDAPGSGLSGDAGAAGPSPPHHHLVLEAASEPAGGARGLRGTALVLHSTYDLKPISGGNVQPPFLPS